MKKLSIVTVVYNANKELKKTIQSINKQSNQNFEYIVVDGMSTDGTIDTITTESRINKYLIEKDNGIYDAMNKAINLVTGDIILFLNAGDEFYDANVVEEIVTKCNIINFDIAYGDVILQNKNSKILKVQPKDINKLYLYTNNLCHQSMIFSKEIFKNIGLFDYKEKIFADYKYLLKAYGFNLKIKHLDIIVCEYDNTNGVSSRLGNFNTIISRGRIIYQRDKIFGLIIFIILNIMVKPIDRIKLAFS